MKSKGFTLIELMIVVAIIGILAAVVVPHLSGKLGKKSHPEATEQTQQATQNYKAQ